MQSRSWMAALTLGDVGRVSAATSAGDRSTGSPGSADQSDRCRPGIERLRGRDQTSARCWSNSAQFGSTSPAMARPW